MIKYFIILLVTLFINVEIFKNYLLFQKRKSLSTCASPLFFYAKKLAPKRLSFFFK